MANAEKIPTIWQQYIQKLKSELKQIEAILKSASGANEHQLRAQVERIRQIIACLT